MGDIDNPVGLLPNFPFRNLEQLNEAVNNGTAWLKIDKRVVFKILNDIPPSGFTWFQVLFFEYAPYLAFVSFVIWNFCSKSGSWIYSILTAIYLIFILTITSNRTVRAWVVMFCVLLGVLDVTFGYPVLAEWVILLTVIVAYQHRSDDLTSRYTETIIINNVDMLCQLWIAHLVYIQCANGDIFHTDIGG
jgi:hypothetical protein